MDWIGRHLSPAGRTGLAGYRWFSLCTTVLGFALGGFVGWEVRRGALIPSAAPLIAAAAMTGSILIGMVAAIRRLHDLGRSGWWMLLFMPGPIVLCALAVVFYFLDPMAALMVLAAAAVVGLWGGVALNLLQGMRGPNAFGPAPGTR